MALKYCTRVTLSIVLKWMIVDPELRLGSAIVKMPVAPQQSEIIAHEFRDVKEN
jgi:hypothetical protein